MRIWLLTPFEPIPTETDARPMRAGMLAAELAGRGHHVVWWTPDFEHYAKRHRTSGDSRIPVNDNYEVRLIKSLGYSSHVGPRRLLHNHLLAKRWKRLANEELQPDLILSAWPTPDLSVTAVRYGEDHSVPVVIDIRDLWPDLWLGILPSSIRSLGRLVLWRYYRMASVSMSRAAAITGSTSDYIDWALGLCNRARGELDQPFEFGFQPLEAEAEKRESAHARLRELGYEVDNRMQVVFAGTFGRSFEFETILQAGRQLDRIAAGRVRIILCGSGDRWQQVADDAERIDSIKVLPRLNLVELQQVYEGSTLALAPYRNIENFQKNVPNKINEYLLMGLPILSGVEGRIASLIEQEGVGRRYQPDDPESLARLIASLAEDPNQISVLKTFVASRSQEVHSKPQGTKAFADHLERIASLRG